MNPLKELHDVGQSIWLDNIRRALLDSGTLAHYISDLSVTGLTSNPTIFEHAIGGSNDYDAAIKSRLGKKMSTEELFFQIALEDITAAADLFRPIYDATNGADGFVSLEVSPTLADDADSTIAQAKKLHAAAARPTAILSSSLSAAKTLCNPSAERGFSRNNSAPAARHEARCCSSAKPERMTLLRSGNLRCNRWRNCSPSSTGIRKSMTAMSIA